MKIVNYCLLGLGILLAISCTKTEIQSKSEIPVVDVTKSYPKKEIVLQDIADVEYIPLETRDDVLIDNHYQVCTISLDSLLVGNPEEGSIFLFDSQGKVLQKFNRKGQSGTEYKEIWGLYYDKEAHEIIVLDYPHKYRFQIYDDEGNYKRTVPINKKYEFRSTEIINYDNEAFLCYDNVKNTFGKVKDSSDKLESPYVLISKKDGTELGQLPLTCSKRITPFVVIKYPNGAVASSSVYLQSITIDSPNFILSEISKDTIYSYAQDKKLKPIMIRTPKELPTEEPISFLQIKKQTK